MRDALASIAFLALIASIAGSFLGIVYGAAYLVSQVITAALAGV